MTDNLKGSFELTIDDRAVVSVILGDQVNNHRRRYLFPVTERSPENGKPPRKVEVFFDTESYAGDAKKLPEIAAAVQAAGKEAVFMTVKGHFELTAASTLFRGDSIELHGQTHGKADAAAAPAKGLNKDAFK